MLNALTAFTIATVLVLASPLLTSWAPEPAQPLEAAESLFFDDFSARDLDRSKWTPEVWGVTVNDEQQAYIDAPDVLAIARGEEAEGADDGALAITARYRRGFTAERTGRRFDFVSGRLITRGKFEFVYGTAQARIKLPEGAGLWPAFWILGTGKWPDTGEIDVMENVGDPSWVSAALHGPGYSGDTPLVSRFGFPAGQNATGWHVYAVDWSHNSIEFRVDALPVYRVSRDMVEKYGRWAFDNPKYLILNLALGGNYPHTVNRTDTPYRGIPVATVEVIKHGNARVLVDWVRVTRPAALARW
jgi:beta-glucanase (GH16 family)